MHSFSVCLWRAWQYEGFGRKHDVCENGLAYDEPETTQASVCFPYQRILSVSGSPDGCLSVGDMKQAGTWR